MPPRSCSEEMTPGVRIFYASGLFERIRNLVWASITADGMEWRSL